MSKIIGTVKKLLAGAIILLGVTGVAWDPQPVSAQAAPATETVSVVETVSAEYSVVVEVTNSYYTDEDEWLLTLEERDGDVWLNEWDGNKYVSTHEILQGKGDVFDEDAYSFADDAFPGDFYRATRHTNGTADPSDDYLTCDGFMGYIVPSNMPQ